VHLEVEPDYKQYSAFGMHLTHGTPNLQVVHGWGRELPRAEDKTRRLASRIRNDFLGISKKGKGEILFFFLNLNWGFGRGKGFWPGI
jgi:hypothetical protein